MRLIVTEKPSVAADIARIVGANKSEEGYYSGNGYLVSYALGHLCGLAMPEDYSAIYNDRNNLRNLPIIPAHYNTVVLPDTKKQFNILRDLYNRPDVDLIIDAGDDGPQGYYLQWLIREKIGCRKRVVKLFTSSLTDENIKAGLNNLIPINEFDGEIKFAYTMAKEDWLIGMNFSRLYTALYKRERQEYFTVGPVQSPTLNFVVKRYNDNKNFVPSDYFDIKVNSDEGVDWKLYDEAKEKIRFRTQEEAERFKSEYKGRYIENIECKKEEKETKPPKLYDITSLERDGVKLYGMSAAKVLEIAQSLYMKKLITYPRTESKYISAALVEEFNERISDIVGNNSVCGALISNGYTFNHIRENGNVNDKKVTDHPAIMITKNYKMYDTGKLSMDEQTILNLIINRMIIASSRKRTYYKYSAEGTVGNLTALTTYNVLKDEGFKYVEKMLFDRQVLAEKDEEDNEEFATYFSGYSMTKDRIYDLEIKKGKTTAPPLLTEDTLLKMMENAGATIEDKELKKAIGADGIGTKATRAGIIEELFKKGYITYFGKDKVKKLVPTEKGQYLISILNESLISAELRAEQENVLNRVRTGEADAETVLKDFEKYVRKIVDEEIKKNNIDMSRYDGTEMDVPCYFCRKPLKENEEKYYCDNAMCGKINIVKETNIITRCSKSQINKQQLNELMTTGQLKNVECPPSQTGKKAYTADFHINPKYSVKGKGYLIEMSFSNSKNK